MLIKSLYYILKKRKREGIIFQYLILRVNFTLNKILYIIYAHIVYKCKTILIQLENKIKKFEEILITTNTIKIIK